MYIPTYLSGPLQIKASRALQMVAQDVLKHYDLKPTQWSILGQLYTRPDMRAADIADALGVEAALVTMVSQELVDRGLIAKLAHHNDGRARVLELTDKGRLAVNHIERVLSANLQQLLHDVPEEDLQAYQRVLEIIANKGEEDSDMRASKLVQRQRRISSIVLLDNLH